MKQETDILIVCEDSYGLDVYTIIQAINACKDDRKHYHVLGFVSDVSDPFGGIVPPFPLVGTIADHDVSDTAAYAMAIRDPARKERAACALKARGARFETLLAPWVLCPADFKAGEGCIIANYCFKRPSVFGDFVIMDAVMCEAVEIGDYSTLCPFVNTTSATVGKRVFVGSHAVIMSHKVVGDSAYIHPGSIVLTNVKPGAVMRGVPAKRVRNHE